MSSKLKLDEAGHAVLQNGMPVWIDADGAEVVFDAPKLFNTVAATRSERDRANEEAKELKAAIKKFGSSPDELEKALQKIKLANSIDESKLVASDKLEEAVTSRLQPFVKERDEEKRTFEEKLSKAEAQVRTVLVSSKFNTAEAIKNLYLTPDAVEAMFGKYFQVEDGEVVAYRDPNDKTSRVYSKADPGKAAEFNEALDTLLKGHANYKNWAKPNAPSGGNAPGGSGSGAGGADISSLSPSQKMQRAFDAARPN